MTLEKAKCYPKVVRISELVICGDSFLSFSTKRYNVHSGGSRDKTCGAKKLVITKNLITVAFK